MKGAIGGPNIVKMPGGVGIRSPTLTNERPATFTPVLAIGPMTSGQGTPENELIQFDEDLKRIEIGDCIADLEKIKDAVGWKPNVSLEEGLQSPFDYYEKNREHYW